MTRKGPAKPVDRIYARGRLVNARAYLKAARDEFELTDEGSNTNPVLSQIINAAIAYTDALTAVRKSLVNQQDHGAAIKLLREAFGRDLPVAHERQLRRILEDKDEVQYGQHRSIQRSGRALGRSRGLCRLGGTATAW